MNCTEGFVKCLLRVPLMYHLCCFFAMMPRQARGTCKKYLTKPAVQIILSLSISCLLPHSGTSEIDQLYKICSVLGTPSRGDWADGFVLANTMSFHFPNFSQTHLSQVRKVWGHVHV